MRCLQWNIILYKQQILHFVCFNIEIFRHENMKIILSLDNWGGYRCWDRRAI